MPGLHQNEQEELKRILTKQGVADIEDILAVLDTFLATEEHLTEAELIRKLKNRGLNLDEEVVKRALELFCRYGFAQIKKFENHEPMYEHRHLGHHHDHLICTRCGGVQEFVSPEMEDLQVRLAKTMGFVPLEHRMEIYGLCRKCALSRKPAVPLCEAECGERVVVVGHQGGAFLKHRLLDMGLTPGVELEVLHRNGGPLVVSCRGGRLALGRGMSKKIMVAPVQNSGESGDK